MRRLVPIAASALALLLAVPAFGADFAGDLRPAYQGDTSPIGFEFGLGYWYSLGAQSFTIGGQEVTTTDTAQFGEGHIRIDDYTTSSYLKGQLGYAYSILGTSQQPDGPVDVIDGRVLQAGADFGYNPFNTASNGQGFTPLIGYQYWNDSPNEGRANFTTAQSADDVVWNVGDPSPVVPYGGVNNNIDFHALRLGISGRSDFGDMFSVSGEVAAVPYAWVNGTYGALNSRVYATPFKVYDVQASPTEIIGHGYGAMGELMVGMHPTDNVTLSLGGRAWYLQGTVDATYDRAVITGPIDTDGDGQADIDPTFTKSHAIVESNPFSLLRYGAVASLSVKF